MSRIRTTQADIRNIDTLKAHGYKKGKQKKLAGNFNLVRRTTDPQTIYVKNALNRDDIVDITDFDYVAYLYSIDRMNLNEELAKAIMIGDGRDDGAEDKIFPEHIRPIWLDDDLYTIHTDLNITSMKAELQGTNTGANFGDNYVYAEAMVQTLLYAREDYKGTGTPDLYCTPHMANVMLLARDLNGRRIYSSKAELATALNVSSINTAEQFANKTRKTSDGKTKKLIALIVNLQDYSLGATKGGEITHFTQFDIDFNQVKLYVGNYDFWYESSKMMQSLMNDQKKRREDKIKELQAFIQRFSSNKSKAKQATSRRKLLDQLTIEQMPASSRRYPWVCFTPEREAGKDILQVSNLNYTQDGVQLLKDVSFIVTKGQKIALVGSNEQAQTALFRILAEEIKPDSGSFKWGVTISTNYFPKDNSKYFDGCNLNMMQWFAQYSPEQLETYMRGFLGRMLFSGDDVYKPVSVLSGGEKVRVMLSRMMLSGANFLMLDQPTNHLDLESITAVNNALINFPGNVIFTSQDHQFITTIADRIIEIKPDGTIADYYCGYEDYLEKIRAQEG